MNIKVIDMSVPVFKNITCLVEVMEEYHTVGTGRSKKGSSFIVVLRNRTRNLREEEPRLFLTPHKGRKTFTGYELLSFSAKHSFIFFSFLHSFTIS